MMSATMDVVKMLRSYAKDMRPSGLGGGGYALASNNHKLLDNAANEIERLQAAGNRFADWIDELYSDLPKDRPPGPPITLLAEMRSAFKRL